MVRSSPISQTSYHLTYELFEVTQMATGSRADVVKALWDYIKTNKLQDPANKREIICDYKLQNLFQQHRVGMFETNRLLQKHFIAKVDDIEDE